MSRMAVVEALEKTGYKKKYIAQRLGVTPEYLSKYLKSPKDIPVEKAAIICELTGKPLNELDFGVDIFLTKNLN